VQPTHAYFAEEEVWEDEVCGEVVGAGGAVLGAQQVLRQAGIAKGVTCRQRRKVKEGTERLR
jgi:hypothetical protein